MIVVLRTAVYYQLVGSRRARGKKERFSLFWAISSSQQLSAKSLRHSREGIETVIPARHFHAVDGEQALGSAERLLVNLSYRPLDSEIS